MLSTCDCSTDMQFLCCLIRINIKTSLTVYKLRDLKINVYILKYAWVESKRIKTDLQSRCAWGSISVSFQDADQSAELSSLLRKTIEKHIPGSIGEVCGERKALQSEKNICT